VRSNPTIVLTWALVQPFRILRNCRAAEAFSKHRSNH